MTTPSIRMRMESSMIQMQVDIVRQTSLSGGITMMMAWKEKERTRSDVVCMILTPSFLRSERRIALSMITEPALDGMFQKTSGREGICS